MRIYNLAILPWFPVILLSGITAYTVILSHGATEIVGPTGIMYTLFMTVYWIVDKAWLAHKVENSSYFNEAVDGEQIHWKTKQVIAKLDVYEKLIEKKQLFSGVLEKKSLRIK